MANPFRVFHCPLEIAGQMGRLVGGLRRYGHVAVGYNYFINYLKYSQDIVNVQDYVIGQVYEQMKDHYDIIHFHFAYTMDKNLRDLPRYRKEGKKLVMHHWGNDVRLASLIPQYSPFLTDPCNPWPDHVMIEQLKQFSRYIPTTIIQDFELYPYVKDYYEYIYVLPLAYPVKETVPVYPSLNNEAPLIIHAPTQPTFKGTYIIENVLTSLSNQGFRFQYKRIENMSNEQAMQVYRQADIVIDQILVGSYGVFAVEAMSLGKPVVGYIREDIKGQYPGAVPIISANPSNLAQALIPLLADAHTRYVAGVEGRKYAEAVHDLSVVIPRLLEIYKVVEDN